MSKAEKVYATLASGGDHEDFWIKCKQEMNCMMSGLSMRKIDKLFEKN